ncbi:MAG: hypothetical protein CMM28_12385 [Rhodospirillaceae bacterium]|nr:hypothetical protein [Rhodospirillaceae bacterium]|tara:strand:- start:2384 stop:3886 length:1503 start_codon:yes stop_codon:yes gene_type:complete
MSQKKYAYYVTSPELRWLWKELGAEIQRQRELIPLLIVRTKEDGKFYTSQFGREFKGEIVVDPDIYGFVVDGGDPKRNMSEVWEKLSIFENDHGMRVFRDQVLAERSFARAYLSGAPKLARSRTSDRATEDLILQACLMAIEHYEDLFCRFPPGLAVVVTGGSCVLGKPLTVLCRKHKVPFRNLTHSRFSHGYFWAEDEYGNAPVVSNAIAEFPNPSDAEIECAHQEISPTGDFTHYVKTLSARMRLSKLLWSSAYNFAAYVYGRLKGYSRTRVTYYPSEVAKQLFRTRAQWRYLSQRKRPFLKDLPNRPFVFFPLQTEPEISLGGLAPYFSNQLTTIMEISLSLPAGVLLVIKEHPVQSGVRGRSFYKSIEALPNTILINIQQDSYPLIDNAALVVSVTSSAAHEAAGMGKKVAYFSPHGVIHAVPHVHHIASYNDLHRLAGLLTDDPDSAKQRQRDGARYFLALRKISLDFPKDQFNLNKVPSEDEICNIANSLLNTL